MHILEQQTHTYLDSLKTNQMLKKFFEQTKVEKRLQKNAKIGLYSVLGIFVIAVGLLIAGAFIKNGQTWANNPWAIAVMTLGLFFLLCLMIPFFIVIVLNRKIVKNFIKTYLDHTTINVFYKKIGAYLKDFSFQKITWNDTEVIYDFLYQKQTYQLVINKDTAFLKIADQLINQKPYDQLNYHDDHWFIFNRIDAAFFKTYPTKCTDYLASQINHKVLLMIQLFVQLNKPRKE
ncbi:hypothetical protein OF376_00245 [Ureaplasma miroungigenitalium]|uniref:DUF3137 domain-containing protein n=1 Tax=Ureaplasma miroungigenitalium TaxID=1042321 RepID=A0ABT3BLT6_9BACT|nr:hypothetical protein [Ureaplasma miroungigenitalium]MCV3728220.1 hypothetical protein [Ureaplasma miroungigenitalium]